MKGATLFSGIDAPEVSAPSIDWLWRAEIDKFANAVADYHRGVPNIGDVSAPDFVERALEHGRPDLIVFGSPCQSFSVAGKRLGLDDPRGNLALVALDVVRRIRPAWFVFENVPGMLSSDEGRDFGIFLETVEECGYSGCWRILDAQYAGVPQRRRRVFFVGYLGDWRPAAAVLFEPESLRWNPPPRREQGQDTAPTLASRTRGGGGLGTDFDCDGGLIARCDTAREGMRQDYETETLIAFSCKDHGADAGDTSLTLRAMTHDGSHANAGGQVAVAIQGNMIGRNENAGPQGKGWQEGAAFTVNTVDVQAVAFAENQRAELRTSDVVTNLNVGGGKPGQGYPAVMTLAIRGRKGSYELEHRSDGTANAVLTPNGGRGGIGVGAIQRGMQVRRITPTEAERLQGFSDDYTRIPWRGKPAEQCPDGPRYKAIGNSMAVPVIGWILERIQKCEALL